MKIRSIAQDWAVARNFYLFRLRSIPPRPPQSLHDQRLQNITTEIQKLVQKAIYIVEKDHASYKQELSRKK